MTRAEITEEVKNLITSVANTSNVQLDGSFNYMGFINDAMEQVMLELVPVMPGQFLTSENVTLIANQANYTLTNAFWQIWKVERTVTGEPPIEFEIIEPLDFAYHTETGDTEADPHAVYFIGDTIYFIKTPSAAKTNYAKVWEIRPEAATMLTTGPAYIPAPAHRLIVYQAAILACQMLGANPSSIERLYARRLIMVEKVWRGRFQSQPRFVRASSHERQGYRGSSEDRDVDW